MDCQQAGCAERTDNFADCTVCQDFGLRIVRVQDVDVQRDLDKQYHEHVHQAHRS
jgi:uncharacterized protein YijF (DUF1287 family)